MVRLRKLLLNFVEEAEKEGNEQLFTVYNYPITLQENIDIVTMLGCSS